MKHLINPLDFSVEETEELLLLAEDIARTAAVTAKSATAKSLPPSFMNQVPGLV